MQNFGVYYFVHISITTMNSYDNMIQYDAIFLYNMTKEI